MLISVAKGTSPMPHLPQELIEAIVDFVKDPKSLGSCSLAASRFCVPCQKILFHKVFIFQPNARPPGYEGAVSIERVLATLTRSPHLAPYVRNLAISALSLPQDLGPLLSIIQTLQHVESLVITGHHDGDYPRSIPAGLITVILDALARPCFSHLCLFHVSQVPGWFVSHVFSSVRVITLHGVHVNSADAATHFTRPLIASNLQDLTIITTVRYGGSIVEAAGNNNPEGLPRLQRLCLSNPYGRPLEEFSRIFAAASQTLQHLELEHGPSGTSFAASTSTIAHELL
jgi:hypothetical protein